MSAPAPASTTTEPTQGPSSERAQRHLQFLDELIELGMDLARSSHAAAKQQLQAATPEPATEPTTTPAAPAPRGRAAHDPTIPFDRITRAVRRCMSLARQLEQPLPTPAIAAYHRVAARKRIIREVEDLIQRTCAPDRAEALQDELLDRLDSPDLDDEIDHRPAAEIIADICRDFGIAAIAGTHPWKRRTPADIAELCARAAAAAPDPAREPTTVHVLNPTRFRGK